MHTWRKIALLPCAAGMLAAACVEPTDQKGVIGATDVSINVLDVSGFTPGLVTIAAGATVTWTWGGNNTYTHNVTFADTAVTSPTQIVGAFPVTFPTAGTFHYRCTVHGESGVVSVH